MHCAATNVRGYSKGRSCVNTMVSSSPLRCLWQTEIFQMAIRRFHPVKRGSRVLSTVDRRRLLRLNSACHPHPHSVTPGLRQASLDWRLFPLWTTVRRIAATTFLLYAFEKKAFYHRAMLTLPHVCARRHTPACASGSACTWSPAMQAVMASRLSHALLLFRRCTIDTR